MQLGQSIPPTAITLKLLISKCTRRSKASDHSDHFLSHINCKNSATWLVAAGLKYVTESVWGSRRYLNVIPLESGLTGRRAYGVIGKCTRFLIASAVYRRDEHEKEAWGRIRIGHVFHRHPSMPVVSNCNNGRYQKDKYPLLSGIRGTEFFSQKKVVCLDPLARQ